MARNDAPLLLDVTRLIWRRWSRRRPTGIDRVCLAYLEHFAADAQAVVHHRRFRRVLDADSSRELFSLLRDPPRMFRTELASRAFRRLGGASCPARGRLYLNIGHTGLDSQGFGRWVRDSSARPIYFVHDLIPLTHPQYCRVGESARHERRMRTVLETGHGIIANSRATIDEIAEFARSQHLSQPPSTAAWLGTSPLRPTPVSRRAPEPPYFVTLGTIEARKNHLLLLKIWSRMVQRLGARAPRLVIIGQRGWEAEAVFAILDRDTSLRDHVIEINDCPDEDLADYLGSARALLFPSKAEGFGLPLVEALASGVPVVASDLAVFREIGQGVPTLVSGGDEAWEDAILDFSRPASPERESQLTRMGSFRVPDWQSHFREVDRWLATLDRDPGGRSSNR